MTPREAKARYLRRRRNDATESSVAAWHGRLKLFVEWCEGVGIAEVGGLKPYDINEYYDLRSGQVQPSTVEGEMYTLKKFCEFLAQIGAVEGLSEKVPIPEVPEDSRSSDVKLDSSEALALLDHYRASDRDYGTRAHAILELAWYTGARQGGLRALDLRDVYLDENYVEFRHRPGTDTPLKNTVYGERTVAVPEPSMEAIREYIGKYRYDVRDDHGRQPLFASARGRADREHVPRVDIHGDAPVYEGYVPAREGEACLRVDGTGPREQVPVESLAAPNSDGEHHLAAELWGADRGRLGSRERRAGRDC